VFIPFMTDGAGARTIGGWFGTGADRGLALVFMLTGIIGLLATFLALRSGPYRRLSHRYVAGPATASELSLSEPTPSGAGPCRTGGG
jgi:DHA3 family multidrug efflux protein-like MFS transporter